MQVPEWKKELANSALNIVNDYRNADATHANKTAIHREIIISNVSPTTADASGKADGTIWLTYG